MILTFTAISYVVGTIAIGGITWRFYQYLMREKTTTSRMFFWFVFFFFLFFLATAFITLFFTGSAFALKLNVVIAAFLQGLGCSFLGYLLVYLKGGKKIPPMAGFLVIAVLGILATVLSVVVSYTPQISDDGLSIVWNVPLSADWPRILYFVATFVPLGIIFFRQFFSTEGVEAKVRALGLGTVMLFGVIAILIEFLQEFLGLRQVHSDIALTTEYLLVIVLLLLPSSRIASRYLGERQPRVGT